jgi:hypothetical protein
MCCSILACRFPRCAVRLRVCASHTFAVDGATSGGSGDAAADESPDDAANPASYVIRRLERVFVVVVVVCVNLHVFSSRSDRGSGENDEEGTVGAFAEYVENSVIFDENLRRVLSLFLERQTTKGRFT